MNDKNRNLSKIRKFFIYLILAFVFCPNASAQTFKDHSKESKTDNTTNIKNRVCKNLKVLPFNQGDDEWGTDVMQNCNGTDYTIEGYGCALTSTAMLLDSGNESVNPGELNTYIKNNNGYSYCANIIWNIVDDYGSSSASFLTFEDWNYSNVKSYINNYDPVILKVKSGDKDTDHFALVIGYEEPGTSLGDFFILDPNGGILRRLSVYEDDFLMPNAIRRFTNVNTGCDPINLPTHCMNCIKDSDLGETDIDCGGECPPCDEGPNYKNRITTNEEFLSENIATNEIVIKPSVSSNNLIIDGTKVFTSGKRIKLQTNYNLQNSSIQITAGSDVHLKTSASSQNLTRNCNDNYDETCIFLPNAVTATTNYIWQMSSTSVEYTFIELFDRWGSKVHEVNQYIWRRA